MEKNSIFDNATSNIPLEDIIAGMKTNNTNIEKENKNEASNKPENEQSSKSPLDIALEEKKKHGSGLVVSNEELENGKDNGPKGDIIHNDERMGDFQKSIDELDDTFDKRKHVTVIKKPMNDAEYIQLMEEVEAIRIGEDGKPYFDFVDSDGNHLTNVIPVFCKLKEESDEDFDFSVLNEYEKNSIKKGKEFNNGESVYNGDTSNKEDELDDEDKISEEKKKTVEILIDKTGFGTDFKFTDEERKKISEAETIRVNEVKVIDIATFKQKRSTSSFQDVINAYDVSGSKVTICFPASGFKAQMKGMSYGEYSDVALSMDSITFDQYYKRMSIIYNKMTNISTGPFDSFEDFLKNFAYSDIPLALYGMFCATELEDQEIALRCGKDDCGKSFNWAYKTRNILRLEKCADTFLEKMKEIATADAMNYDAIRENSAVKNSKLIELPDTKTVVEIGIASSYDFLYNFIPVMDEKTFRDSFGDDLNDTYLAAVSLLTAVRRVYILDGNDQYVEATGYKNIVDALYKYITPKEIKIVQAYANKVSSLYEIVFSFGDVVCPHCGNVTHDLDVTMDELVFQTFNRLISTDIDLSKIRDL